MNKLENTLLDYKNFDNATIIELAQKPRTLRAENIPLLVQEIKNRKIDTDLLNWIEQETKTFDEVEREELLKNIQGLNCTKCKTQNNLYGYKLMRVISFIILHSDSEYDLIICSNCATQLRIRNLILTTLFGWWSIMGILKTPFVIFNILSTIINPLKNSETILNSFIDNNTGKLRTLNIELENLLQEFNDYNEGNESEERE